MRGGAVVARDAAGRGRGGGAVQQRGDVGIPAPVGGDDRGLALAQVTRVGLAGGVRGAEHAVHVVHHLVGGPEVGADGGEGRGQIGGRAGQQGAGAQGALEGVGGGLEALHREDPCGLRVLARVAGQAEEHVLQLTGGRGRGRVQHDGGHGGGPHRVGGARHGQAQGQGEEGVARDDRDGEACMGVLSGGDAHACEAPAVDLGHGGAAAADGVPVDHVVVHQEGRVQELERGAEPVHGRAVRRRDGHAGGGPVAEVHEARADELAAHGGLLEGAEQLGERLGAGGALRGARERLGEHGGDPVRVLHGPSSAAETTARRTPREARGIRGVARWFDRRMSSPRTVTAPGPARPAERTRATRTDTPGGGPPGGSGGGRRAR